MNKIMIVALFHIFVSVEVCFAIVPNYPEILRQKDWKNETTDFVKDLSRNHQDGAQQYVHELNIGPLLKIIKTKYKKINSKKLDIYEGMKRGDRVPEKLIEYEEKADKHYKAKVKKGVMPMIKGLIKRLESALDNEQKMKEKFPKKKVTKAFIKHLEEMQETAEKFLQSFVDLKPLYKDGIEKIQGEITRVIQKTIDNAIKHTIRPLSAGRNFIVETRKIVGESDEETKRLQMEYFNQNIFTRARDISQQVINLTKFKEHIRDHFEDLDDLDDVDPLLRAWGDGKRNIEDPNDVDAELDLFMNTVETIRQWRLKQPKAIKIGW